MDSFELPPGIEKTRIPKRLNPRHAGGPATPEDIRHIEAVRADIERLFASGDYEQAESVYGRYVSMLEKVGVDDIKLSDALKNYAALLRRLGKEAEAQTIEFKGNAVFARSGQQRQTYALKDYKLGMSLDAFANLLPPGADVKKVKGICSCDAGQSIETTTQEERNAKVVQCGFWTVLPNGSVGPPYAMTVANIQCEPDFRFIENGGAYRLFEISIAFYNSNFDGVKQALVEKYGQPTATEVEKIKTEMGNNYPLTNLIWDNGVSKIRLTNAEGTNTGRAKLRYIHEELFLVYAKRVNEARDNSGKQAATDL